MEVAEERRSTARKDVEPLVDELLFWIQRLGGKSEDATFKAEVVKEHIIPLAMKVGMRVAKNDVPFMRLEDLKTLALRNQEIDQLLKIIPYEQATEVLCHRDPAKNGRCRVVSYDLNKHLEMFESPMKKLKSKAELKSDPSSNLNTNDVIQPAVVETPKTISSVIETALPSSQNQKVDDYDPYAFLSKPPEVPEISEEARILRVKEILKSGPRTVGGICQAFGGRGAWKTDVDTTRALVQKLVDSGEVMKQFDGRFRLMTKKSSKKGASEEADYDDE